MCPSEYADNTAPNAKCFLEVVANPAPYHLMRFFTDNGPEFTDPFAILGEGGRPGRNHAFGQLCAALHVEPGAEAPQALS